MRRRGEGCLRQARKAAAASSRASSAARTSPSGAMRGGGVAWGFAGCAGAVGAADGVGSIGTQPYGATSTSAQEWASFASSTSLWLFAL